MDLYNLAAQLNTSNVFRQELAAARKMGHQMQCLLVRAFVKDITGADLRQGDASQLLAYLQKMPAPDLNYGAAFAALSPIPGNSHPPTISVATKETNVPFIQNKTFVNGIDFAHLSDEQATKMIADKEAELENFGKIKAKPASLKKQIADTEADIAALVKLLDERFEKKNGKAAAADAPAA